MSRPYQVERGVRVPMRDGVSLSATIYRPTGRSGRLPVIVTITPYTVDRVHDVAAFFARHRYPFAAVDTRGRGDSDGAFYPTTHEADDGYDVVQWLSQRPECDGQVGMWGGSYSGRNQWVTAAARPPALRTIVPASAGFAGIDRDMRANIPFPQPVQWWAMVSGRTLNERMHNDRDYWLGVLAEQARGERPFRDFDALAGFPSPMWRANLEHPELDAYWATTTGDASQLSPEQLAGVEIPILSITGAYDASQAGAFAFHEAFLATASPTAAKRAFMVLGSWDHHGTRAPKRVVGGVDFGPQSVIDILALHLAWYDWILKDGPRPTFLEDRFVAYLAGANRWLAAPSLAAATLGVRRLYLSSPSSDASSLETRGELVSAAPPQPADQYVYDPAEPGRNEGLEGYDLVGDDYLTDARAVARLHGEGLIYDSAPLEEPLVLLGRPRAELILSMDVPDTDIRVVLYAVQADGTQILLVQDQMRARYRTSLQRPELVTPGRAEVYRFARFDIVARALERGDRLRLVISPLGLSIHTERNRNSGGVVADETATDNRVATVQVALGPDGSWLELPIGAL